MTFGTRLVKAVQAYRAADSPEAQRSILRSICEQLSDIHDEGTKPPLSYWIVVLVSEARDPRLAYAIGQQFIRNAESRLKSLSPTDSGEYSPLTEPWTHYAIALSNGTAKHFSFASQEGTNLRQVLVDRNADRTIALQILLDAYAEFRDPALAIRAAEAFMVPAFSSDQMLIPDIENARQILRMAYRLQPDVRVLDAYFAHFLTIEGLPGIELTPHVRDGLPFIDWEQFSSTTTLARQFERGCNLHHGFIFLRRRYRQDYGAIRQQIDNLRDVVVEQALESIAFFQSPDTQRYLRQEARRCPAEC